MPETFATLVPDAQTFLTALAADNSRDWFTAHKAEYETRLKAPALALLDVMAAELDRENGAPVTTKLFRPHRDVRFSKDKTPYHTHLHMLWSRPDGVARFFGIAPGYVSCGAGVMSFDKPALNRWRKAVDGSGGPALAGAISAACARGARLDPPALKRVPPPYDKDHPRGDLLRRKGLALWHDLSGPDVADLPGALRRSFDDLRPVTDLLAAL